MLLPFPFRHFPASTEDVQGKYGEHMGSVLGETGVLPGLADAGP